MGDAADDAYEDWLSDQALAMDDDEGAWCPKCGRWPRATNTAYGVKRHCCGLWAWGESAPLVDAETHQARQYAHRVFDGLWQSGLVDRSRAYALLALELALHPSECRMKLMDKETARRVPAATHEIWKRLKQGTRP